MSTDVCGLEAIGAFLDGAMNMAPDITLFVDRIVVCVERVAAVRVEATMGGTPMGSSGIKTFAVNDDGKIFSLVGTKIQPPSPRAEGASNLLAGDPVSIAVESFWERFVQGAIDHEGRDWRGSALDLVGGSGSADAVWIVDI